LPPIDLSPGAVAFDDSTARNGMPSMHTAWALAVFIHSRGGPRWLRSSGTFWLVCTIAATLGFGYHYGVDLVAGAVLCLTVESALREPARGRSWSRMGLVAFGAAFLALLLVCCRYLAEVMARYPLLFGPLIIGTMVVFSTAFYATFFARPQPRRYHRGGGWDPVGAQQRRRGRLGQQRLIQARDRVVAASGGDLHQGGRVRTGYRTGSGKTAARRIESATSRYNDS
jgi:hypothetical protein